MGQTGAVPDFREWLERVNAAPARDALNAARRATLTRFAVREQHARGAVLVEQGVSPARVLLLEQGEVELVRVVGNERLTVQRLGPRALVGDLPLLLGIRSPYTAIAVTDVVAWALDLDALAAALQADPQIAFDWLRAVVVRLERSYRRLLEMSGKSALERVAQCLVDETEQRGQPVVPLTQTELGRVLALSRQTVSAALRELEAHGLAARRHGRVEVLDAARLRRVAHSSRTLGPR